MPLPMPEMTPPEMKINFGLNKVCLLALLGDRIWVLTSKSSSLLGSFIISGCPSILRQVFDSEVTQTRGTQDSGRSARLNCLKAKICLSTCWRVGEPSFNFVKCQSLNILQSPDFTDLVNH